MNAKTTRVNLKCESLGVREFEISHAERLLRIANNGGWEIADKDFEFKDGVIVRRHKEEDKRGRKEGGSK